MARGVGRREGPYYLYLSEVDNHSDTYKEWPNVSSVTVTRRDEVFSGSKNLDLSAVN